MKLAHSLALLATTALSVPSALANFHVVLGLLAGGGSLLVACPSNYYNCDCFINANRAGPVVVDGVHIGSLPYNRDFFSVQGGLCREGQLNFYKRGDGHWDFYVANGDGSLKGTCYSNIATTMCSGSLFTDELVCYSDICGI